MFVRGPANPIPFEGRLDSQLLIKYLHYNCIMRNILFSPDYLSLFIVV